MDDQAVQAKIDEAIQPLLQRILALEAEQKQLKETLAKIPLPKVTPARTPATKPNTQRSSTHLPGRPAADKKEQPKKEQKPIVKIEEENGLGDNQYGKTDGNDDQTQDHTKKQVEKTPISNKKDKDGVKNTAAQPVKRPATNQQARTPQVDKKQPVTSVHQKGPAKHPIPDAKKQKIKAGEVKKQEAVETPEEKIQEKADQEKVEEKASEEKTEEVEHAENAKDEKKEARYAKKQKATPAVNGKADPKKNPTTTSHHATTLSHPNKAQKAHNGPPAGKQRKLSKADGKNSQQKLKHNKEPSPQIEKVEETEQPNTEQAETEQPENVGATDEQKVAAPADSTKTAPIQ